MDGWDGYCGRGGHPRRLWIYQQWCACRGEYLSLEPHPNYSCKGDEWRLEKSFEVMLRRDLAVGESADERFLGIFDGRRREAKICLVRGELIVVTPNEKVHLPQLRAPIVSPAAS